MSKPFFEPLPSRWELADQAMGDVVAGFGEHRKEPVDVVGVLVYVLGASWFLIGPVVYLLDLMSL